MSPPDIAESHYFIVTLSHIKTKSSVSLGKITDCILVVPKSSILQRERGISDQSPQNRGLTASVG